MPDQRQPLPDFDFVPPGPAPGSGLSGGNLQGVRQQVDSAKLAQQLAAQATAPPVLDQGAPLQLAPEQEQIVEIALSDPVILQAIAERISGATPPQPPGDVESLLFGG